MPSEDPASKQVRILDTSTPAELSAAMAWSSGLGAALLDPTLWRESLHTYARATNLAVALSDTRGHLIGECLNPQPTWHCLQAAAAVAPPVPSRDARGVRCPFALRPRQPCPCIADALAQGRVAFARDPTRLVHFAVPLILDGQRLGAVLAGQVFDQYPEPAVLAQVAGQLGLAPAGVWQKARLEVLVKRDTLRVYADLLEHLSQGFLHTRFDAMQEAERLAEMTRLRDLAKQGRFEAMRAAAEVKRQHATLEAHVRVRQHLEAQLRQTQKMEALGTLAGGIAHEFNNILAALLGFATLLHREVPPESRAGLYVQQVRQAGNRAKELVQQILTFSRAESLAREPLQLDRVVQEALTLLRASLPSTVDIQYHVSEPGVMVQANRTQLHEVIMNLGANADYAMRESGGRLTVRVDLVEVDAAFATAYPPLSPGRHVCLTVDDTGSGIPPEVMTRIFEPFFTTKPTGAGTGMGLATVHGIITSHEGVVTVESTQGAGTRFAVYLPAVDTPVTQVAAPDLPVPQGKGRVLFVDDEDTVALAMRFLLESLGYDVVVHTRSSDALEAFRTDPDRFDVVITDQTMPQMTGEDFIHALRRLRPEMPVILCTGFRHVMDAKKAQALGQVTFLMKPVDEYELGVLLQQLLVRQSKFP